MSTLILPDMHFHALLTAGLKIRPGMSLTWYHHTPSPDALRFGDRGRRLDSENATVAGQMLRQANYDAYNETYAHHENTPLTPIPYTFRLLAGYPDPLTVLKAIACLDCHAGDVKNWEQTEAFAFCRTLERYAIAELPNYNEAEGWFVDDPQVFVKASRARQN